MYKVAILLSTYNGEIFLKEQLDSLINQTYSNFTIYIRDDGSSDNTMGIIKNYKKRYPHKIKVIHDTLGNIGVKKSFERLMLNVSADFYFFSDQDDIWNKNKIKLLLNTTLIKNNKYPLMIFSDMNNVNNNLHIIDKSVYKRKVNVSNNKIKKGFFKPLIAGCLMIFNNKSKEIYFKYYVEEAYYHDYHMTIISWLFGKIYFYEDILIDHRIHNLNVAGEGSQISLIIEIKDLIKYIFNNKDYRIVRLKSYFKYIDQLKTYTDIHNLLIQKELFDLDIVNNLSYFSRKKWYLSHFFSTEKGLLVELIRLLLI